MLFVKLINLKKHIKKMKSKKNGVNILEYVSKPVTFTKEIEGTEIDLIVPEGFVKDLHFSTNEHFMLILRVVGPDMNKVVKFFENGEDEVYHIDTEDAVGGRVIKEDYILTDIYMDEGPNLGVDIDIEPAMIRLILDFLLKE
jgi:hypothetical protein